MDPQGNATMGSGVDKNTLELSGYDMLTKRATASQVIFYVEASGFDILPANGDLTAAEVELMNEIGREHRLRLAINTVREHYDYILIDCPPSLNLLTVNALSAADTVLIPMQCEYYALEGLSALLETIESVRKMMNPELSIEGVLMTMYDSRNRLTGDVSAQLIDYFGDSVYKTVIPRNVRLAEAPSHGLPIMQYDSSASGARAYRALAAEILGRDDSEIINAPSKGARRAVSSLFGRRKRPARG